MEHMYWIYQYGFISKYAMLKLLKYRYAETRLMMITRWTTLISSHVTSFFLFGTEPIDIRLKKRSGPAS